jgi:hypothetical protein
MLSTVASAAPRPRSIEEQDVSDVDSGKAILGCYPLHQLGDLQGELDCKGLERVGATIEATSPTIARRTASPTSAM